MFGAQKKMQHSSIGKRGLLLLEESSISKALSFLCRCKILCSDSWTRLDIRRARRAYFQRSLREQLIFVYDVLLAVRNKETNELTLKITGI